MSLITSRMMAPACRIIPPAKIQGLGDKGRGGDVCCTSPALKGIRAKRILGVSPR